ncbi:hypothetical protein [Streptomyces sp. NBC_01304]|uniref:hypothetical protein n=1 Tax=Streptomyces sp. NBC_01304 TaxID=2903818 RepID=UPI002E1083E2|nr:hypothetical protein OG430_41805 [Streptomyces sp. NBC_01304]
MAVDTRARAAVPDAEGGRGLLLLEGLAHRWGVTWIGGAEPVDKRVWFELREG